MRTSSSSMLSLIASTFLACSSGSSTSEGTPDHEAEDSSSEVAFDGPAPEAAADSVVASAHDPFAEQPDESEGLTNVSTDLDAVLEHGALSTACSAYFAGAKDRKSKLLCGKAMFFYEGYGTAGVPKPLVTFMVENFPDELGHGFEKVGMIPDPSSKEHLPIGLAPGGKLGTVETLAFTCASCHFAKLSDGRYAVGAPNLGWDYGGTNLILALPPSLVAPGAKRSDHDDLAVARVQTILDRLDKDSALKLKMMSALLPLLSAGAMAPPFPKTDERHYAQWKPGTMDFLISPLPFDDHVHTVSKISALWGIPSAAEQKAAGMESAMLGFTGSTASLENFTYGFVDLGGGKIAEWPIEKREPLIAYVESLRAPKNPAPQDGEQVKKGEALFRDQGCLACHGGPRGSGLTTYDFATIGTDDAMKKWGDDPSIHFPAPDKLTHALKSPRLVGLWAIARFLHNGSVEGLDALFCGKGARPTITESAYGDGGHVFGCGLSEADASALRAYLLAH
jgi:mono/diheme cytochrome c family protein